MEEEEPEYIRNLLDPSEDYSCYFHVGDPCLGPVERIGVVPAMLMAHSMVFRRLLNYQVSDLDERWDVLMVNIEPRIFKNMLRFTYGFNAISSYSIEDAMELLVVADKFVMHAMEEHIISHIKSNLSPQNLCLVLQYPVAVLIEDLEKEICKIIQTRSKILFDYEEFYMICPATMRHIVGLETIYISQLELWKVVVKWARQKVLNGNPRLNVSPLESRLQLRLLTPSVQNLRLCTLSIITLVELHSQHKPSECNRMKIESCHVVPPNPPRSLFICTHTKNDTYIVHELFQVKILYDCCTWVGPSMKNSSEFIINTRNVGVNIHALVCTGIKKELALLLFGAGSLKSRADPLYNCKCTVTTTLITSTDEERIVSETNFEEEVFVNEEFKIDLNSNNTLLKLEPNTRHKFKVTFFIAHPLWYAHDIDNPILDNTDIDIQYCIVDDNLYGSHVKYVVYKCVDTKKQLTTS